MTQRNLQYWEKNGLTTVFFDPNNIDNKMTHKVELLKKPIGQERVRTIRLDMSQVRNYKFNSCNQPDCGTNDIVSARVILSGATVAEVIQNWRDLCANVEQAILNKSLQGVPLSAGTATLVVDSPSPSAG